jgi:hypothetical protein
MSRAAQFEDHGGIRVSNFDISKTEVERLRSLAQERGHDPDALSGANLLRAALGFELRKQGGSRKRAKPLGTGKKQRPVKGKDKGVAARKSMRRRRR